MCGRYKITKPLTKTVDLVKSNIKVDDINDENLNNNLNNIYLKDDNLQNKIYFKNLLNDAIKSYAG